MENQTIKVSTYCKVCDNRISKNQPIKADCKKCAKIHITVQELNHYINIMNQKYETNVPKFEMVI
jgi:hypothetical protein